MVKTVSIARILRWELLKCPRVREFIESSILRVSFELITYVVGISLRVNTF